MACGVCRIFVPDCSSSRVCDFLPRDRLGFFRVPIARSSSRKNLIRAKASSGGGSIDENAEFRERLERSISSDDASFSGRDLAQLIRKKYGRSYDVQLLQSEAFGKTLLTLNVMWRYKEQQSFRMSEEEYILHLDTVANTVRSCGAVAIVRNTLERTKERPRVGKAVSIQINTDASGRANEWIDR